MAVPQQRSTARRPRCAVWQRKKARQVQKRSWARLSGQGGSVRTRGAEPAGKRRGKERKKKTPAVAGDFEAMCMTPRRVLHASVRLPCGWSFSWRPSWWFSFWPFWWPWPLPWFWRRVPGQQLQVQRVPPWALGLQGRGPERLQAPVQKHLHPTDQPPGQRGVFSYMPFPVKGLKERI